MNTADALMKLLLRELNGFRAELALFPDDDTVWKTLPGVSNAVGNLALHVAGNLQYFLGTVLGQTGFVRNREMEFGRRSGSRAEVLKEIEAAEAVVRAVVPQLSESVLSSEFPEPIMGMKVETGRFLLHLCVHAGFHLGQAGYLRRALTGSTTSSSPLPLGPLTL